MIFMTVRNRKTLDFLDIIFQISDIRDNKVDPQHIVLRECKSAVHNHNAVIVLDRGNIHPDLL